MDEMFEAALRSILRVFTPESTTEKVMAAIDSTGIFAVIMLYGLNFKEHIDGILSSLALLFTVLSLLLTVIFKAEKGIREWRDAARKKKELKGK